jgi:hypothetical protein
MALLKAEIYAPPIKGWLIEVKRNVGVKFYKSGNN